MKTNSTALVLPSPASNSGGTNALDIRDLRGPVEIPSGWAWLWWTLAVLVVTLLGWLAWKRWKKQQAKVFAERTRGVPAHVRARQELREALAIIGQPRPFCVAISDTLRVYLEERFSLHAPDRTTEEFLTELQTSKHLTDEQKQGLADFLARCDLVKFAKYEPAEPELRDLYDAAVDLVEQTMPGPKHLSLESTAGAPVPPRKLDLAP
jgi:hypothetical protein